MRRPQQQARVPLYQQLTPRRDQMLTLKRIQAVQVVSRTPTQSRNHNRDQEAGLAVGQVAVLPRKAGANAKAAVNEVAVDGQGEAPAVVKEVVDGDIDDS